jgi:hypothetical protein
MRIYEGINSKNNEDLFFKQYFKGKTLFFDKFFEIWN